MVANTDQQTLQLDSLVAGVTYMLVITGATQTSTLQFKHAGDPVVRDHPDHTAVAAAPVIVKTFLCPSPVMALVFAAAPLSNYYVTVTPVTEQEF